MGGMSQARDLYEQAKDMPIVGDMLMNAEDQVRAHVQDKMSQAQEHVQDKVRELGNRVGDKAKRMAPNGLPQLAPGAGVAARLAHRTAELAQMSPADRLEQVNRQLAASANRPKHDPNRFMPGGGRSLPVSSLSQIRLMNRQRGSKSNQQMQQLPVIVPPGDKLNVSPQDNCLPPVYPPGQEPVQPWAAPANCETNLGLEAPIPLVNPIRQLQQQQHGLAQVLPQQVQQYAPLQQQQLQVQPQYAQVQPPR